jgi:hypothetical protein
MRSLSTSMALNPTLAALLAPAYAPCVEFQRACVEMRWNPDQGHVPRGFLGAAGSLEEVELVLVFAEPGDPHDGERHTGLESAYKYATFGFGTGKDLFHRNVRNILSMCWPTLSFEEQMRKVWLTESVLCSAKKEGGSVSVSASQACGQRYLLAQLSLFPKALVVALGSKAANRLRTLGVVNFVAAYAAAPPGCNKREAMPSWERIPHELHRHGRDCA